MTYPIQPPEGQPQYPVSGAPMSPTGPIYVPVPMAPPYQPYRNPTNHVLHLILTLITCGVWSVIWIAVWLWNEYGTHAQAVYRWERERGLRQ